eukprot:Pgem_evm5s12025
MFLVTFPSFTCLVIMPSSKLSKLNWIQPVIKLKKHIMDCPNFYKNHLGLFTAGKHGIVGKLEWRGNIPNTWHQVKSLYNDEDLFIPNSKLNSKLNNNDNYSKLNNNNDNYSKLNNNDNNNTNNSTFVYKLCKHLSFSPYHEYNIMNSFNQSKLQNFCPHFCQVM